MAESSSISLLSRYQGCIAGAVFGDCIGARLEKLWAPKPIKSVIELVKPRIKEGLAHGKNGFVLYTDDTCMTFDLGESLVNKKRFDPHDVASRFSETYFASGPQRYYGGNVTQVFRDLKVDDYKDPWGPAKKQFSGTGSYGNGSAMRVSPVTLFAHGNAKEIVDLASQQSKITHTHKYGVVGAVLQALAIEKAMTCGKIDNAQKFCEELLEEVKEHIPDFEDAKIYEEKFEEVKKLLALDREVTDDDIHKIGTDVTAQQAVPAAIFCFLYMLDKTKIQKLKKYNGFTRTIFYSVAVSCDSDTVGSMAGALAGAYYGFEEVPEKWKKACEGADKAFKMAKDLYEINQKGLQEKSD